MNSCPSCHRAYEDETMKFCLDDGTALLPATVASDPDATLVLPTPQRGGHDHTAGIGQTPTFAERPMSTLVDQTFASPRIRAAESSRQSPLPWILGIVFVLGISAVGVAFIVTRALLQDRRDQVSAVTSSPTPPEIKTAESPSTRPDNSSNSTDSEVASNSPGRTQANSLEKKPSPTTTIVTAPSTSPNEAPPPSSRLRAPLSGGVLNGKAVHLVQPAYPPIARQAHVSGTVIVQVLIDENGNVVSAHAVSGHPLLQAVSVAAARASKFSPTKLSGQPVKVTGVVRYNFVTQ